MLTFHLRHLTIRNRMLSTAHEPAYTEDGLPKERYRHHHVEKARGGIGMTMIGACAVVSRDSPAMFGNNLLYKDECVHWLRELAAAVHDHDTAVMIQTTHPGRRNTWDTGDWLPGMAPSHTREPAQRAYARAYAKAMEDWDIVRVIGDYADAAERVKEAGLDGIEIEMYGHLIDQFWSPLTNRREETYGGSLENRMRFGMEVLAAIRARVGPDCIVGARLVCDEDLRHGISADEGLRIAQRLKASGHVDFLTVIRGHVDRAAGLARVIPGMGAASAPHLDFAAGIRAATEMPVFHVARVQDVATARHATITLNLRLLRVERAGNRVRAVVRDEYTRKDVVREADQVVWEAGVQPVDALYFALKPLSRNLGEVDQAAMIGHLPQDVTRNPEGRFTLFRIGDAVASRNIHAAIYDALRLLKDL